MACPRAVQQVGFSWGGDRGVMAIRSRTLPSGQFRGANETKFTQVSERSESGPRIGSTKILSARRHNGRRAGWGSGLTFLLIALAVGIKAQVVCLNTDESVPLAHQVFADVPILRSRLVQSA